jgi:hypothetical protein
LPFPLAGCDGLVIDYSITCEFAGGCRANGGWRIGQLHTNDILEARARVKTNKYKDAYALVPEAMSPAIVSVSGRIHIAFLRLLWILADNQVKSYFERMGQDDRIGGESCQWVRPRTFNSNENSVGRAVAYARGTRCHLSVHSLAQPYAEVGRGPSGSGPGASRDTAPCSRSDNVAGHNNTSGDGGPPSSASDGVVAGHNNTSGDGGPPSSASHGVAQHNGSRHGLGAAGAASSIAPNAIDAVSLDDNRNVHLDSMLAAATFRAAQDGLWASHVAVGTPMPGGVGCSFASLMAMQFQESSMQAPTSLMKTLPIHTLSVQVPQGPMQSHGPQMSWRLLPTQ